MKLGEVAERLKAAVSKTVVGVTPPGVQIPPSPPYNENNLTVERFKQSDKMLNMERWPSG